MSDLVLCDTDILIDAGRKVHEAVVYFEAAEQKIKLGISVVTQM